MNVMFMLICCIIVCTCMFTLYICVNIICINIYIYLCIRENNGKVNIRYSRDKNKYKTKRAEFTNQGIKNVMILI